MDLEDNHTQTFLSINWALNLEEKLLIGRRHALNLNIHSLVMFLTQRPVCWYRSCNMTKQHFNIPLCHKRFLSTGQQERNTELTNSQRIRTVLNAKVSSSHVDWCNRTGSRQVFGELQWPQIPKVT